MTGTGHVDVYTLWPLTCLSNKAWLYEVNIHVNVQSWTVCACSCKGLMGMVAWHKILSEISEIIWKYEEYVPVGQIRTASHSLSALHLVNEPRVKERWAPRHMWLWPLQCTIEHVLLFISEHDHLLTICPVGKICFGHLYSPLYLDSVIHIIILILSC